MESKTARRGWPLYLHSQKFRPVFFVSLGPDNSGWAATRVFRHRGFLKKMRRTSALSLYGPRTAFSGTLFPARPMGTSFKDPFREWRGWGFEVSPHGYDHILWHDRGRRLDARARASGIAKVVSLHRVIFGEDPESFRRAGLAGRRRFLERDGILRLLYHSDTRGDHPFFPKMNGVPLKTLEIPTTLPTWG